MEKIQFIEKVSAFVEKHQLLNKDSKVLVTLSGGADSVALLMLLHNMNINCIVAHCNFHLRGDESMRDENFVRALCLKLNITCIVTDFDVYAYVKNNNLSIEMACRELRYDWFESLRNTEMCDSIAVAHHSDDRIETLFLNMLRGTGIAGLASIKPKNGYIVRPLLCVSRQDIEDYLHAIGEPFIIDSTNAENDFKRNKLRNLVLPLLKQHFPDAETGILRTIENLYTSNNVYQSAINHYKMMAVSHIDNGAIIVDLSFLINVDGCSAILYEILKEYDYNFSQVEDIISSHNKGNSGKYFSTGKYNLLLNRGLLNITPNIKINDDDELTLDLRDTKTHIPWLNIDTINIDPSSPIDYRTPLSIAYFDESICDTTILLRKWRSGDRFTPYGMHGSKKVSDLFVDMKVSIAEKKNIWVMTANDEIIWVVGLRRSSLYLPSPQSKVVVRFESI